MMGNFFPVVTVKVLCALVIRSQVDSLFRCCHRRTAETSGKKTKSSASSSVNAKIERESLAMETPKADACHVPQEMNRTVRKAKGTKNSEGRQTSLKKNVSEPTTPLCCSWQCFPCSKTAEKTPHN